MDLTLLDFNELWSVFMLKESLGLKINCRLCLCLMNLWDFTNCGLCVCLMKFPYFPAIESTRVVLQDDRCCGVLNFRTMQLLEGLPGGR